MSANSLLVQDVPPRGVVIGVPARLVSKNGSLNQIAYRNMENDTERNDAVAEESAASSLSMQPRSQSGAQAPSR
ncbi:MAG: hypothetical protein L0K86_00215 [Actinomycetia bacterium]|nr:hypothetical protein [Actinomycetes bacterium]